MTPIQQLFLGQGAKKTTIYIENIFSTYLYTGNSSSRAINTGINMSEGGLVWIKNRNQGYHHSLQDTVRGAGKDKRLSSNLNSAQNGTDLNNYWAGYISAFNNNGFSIEKEGTGAIDWANYNKSGDNYVAWSFKIQSGFFSCKTWDGNSTVGRQILHGLKSVPGMAIIKETTGTENWTVYHRGNPNPSTDELYLNLNNDVTINSTAWNSKDPTKSYIELGDNNSVNATGKSYVGYFFGGGASNSAESVSVDFDGNDSLSVESSSDLSFGTGDYTVEFWFNADTINDSPLFENRVSGASSDASGFTLTAHGSTNGVRIWWNGASRINGGGSILHKKQWYHLAVTRSSGTTYLFLNGILLGTTTDSINLTTTEAHFGGGKYSGTNSISHYYDGKISNVRIIKGTAIYTSSFRPPTEPLTNITNTKLLCCNNSSVTGKTVGGTITANGNPSANNDSPFFDSAGFVFGEDNEPVIKCGNYLGNGDTTNGTKIFLGFEPQVVLIKSTGFGEEWHMFDAMRGMGESSDVRLEASTLGSELSTADFIKIRPDGFIALHNPNVNKDGENYIFMCIRRGDAYVSKLPEIGSDCFAMDTGNSSTDGPTFDSGFPVDMGLRRMPSGGSGIDMDWATYNRLLGSTYLRANLDATENSSSRAKWDLMTGFNHTDSSSYQAWMWKRSAGFDVVAGLEENNRHNLGKAPEMVWIKRRDNTSDWFVWHEGLNGGGNNSLGYHVRLNQDYAQSNNAVSLCPIGTTLPTTTHFGTSSDSDIRHSKSIALLFTSVEGISKCGTYSGGAFAVDVPCGFVPRFVLIKKINETGPWVIHDTLRGINAGNDCYIFLNDDAGQDCNYDTLDLITSGDTADLGFSVPTIGSINDNGDSYIFYAHS